MEVNKSLKNLKEIQPITPREEKLREIVALGQDAYFGAEKEQLLSAWEFLWTQIRFTRKRWWVLQGTLLLLSYWLISGQERDAYQIRSLGVIGCLFVVLIIPELWRNKTTDSTQVEFACLYSLRQVYAARLTLFCLVDVALLTAFSLSLGSLGFTANQVLFQFLLPVTVTAAICFWTFCGRQNWSEGMSVSVCLTWSAGWWLLLRNEGIYARITPGLWVVLFTAALAFLALAVRRSLRTTNQYWEVAYL